MRNHLSGKFLWLSIYAQKSGSSDSVELYQLYLSIVSLGHYIRIVYKFNK